MEFGTEIITQEMVGKTVAMSFPTMKEEVVSAAKAGAFDLTLKELTAKEAIEKVTPPTCSTCLVKWNAEKGDK